VRRDSSRRAGSRPERGLAHRLLLLLGTCALAGLLIAGLLLPLVGGAGLAARAAANTFEDFPAELADPVLAQRTVLLDRNGKTFATLHGPEDRVVVPSSDDIPDSLKKAVVAIEDSRFYSHHGVDFQGIARALVRNGQSGATRQGGSTLTQQYVKLVLLESAHTDAERAAAVERSTKRKLREARLALELEKRLSKDQILLDYLNIAYFGEGVYGVGTAAQHYFGVRPTDLRQLTLDQSAMLAGLVNSPNLYNPFAHPVGAKNRRDTVLERMKSLGYIDAAAYAAAVAAPLPKRGRAPAPLADACEGTGTAAFFCDYVRTLLRQDRHLGDTQEERDRAVFEGGLRVRTTLDPTVQVAAQKAVDTVVPGSDPKTAIVAAVEPGTGRVLAIAANRTYTSRKGVGTTLQGYLGYRPIFQGGSTFKMFTLVAAVAKGIPLRTPIFAPACLPLDPEKYDQVRSPRCDGIQNSDPTEAGTYDLVRGTWHSVNTFFVQLEQRVGVDTVISTAEDMGIRKQAFAGLTERSVSVTLGAVEGVSPIEEATAFATLAAHGLRCDPRAMSIVVDARNRPVELDHAAPCRQVIDPDVADTVTSVLQGVLTQPGATAYGRALPGRPAAGKTGTLDNQSAAWFTGFTPQLSMAVALGDPAAPSRPMGVVQGVYPVYGGTLPAEIWQQAMTGALDGQPAEPLPRAVASVADGTTTALPDVTGQSSDEATSQLEGLGLAVRPLYVDTYGLPYGAVVGTIPGTGASVTSGGSVRLMLSTGRTPSRPRPAPPPPAPSPTAPSPTSAAPAPAPTPAAVPAGAPQRASPSPP